ncbi:uncharacterized protein K02A2.6 [Trichonephila clavipes]|nr:uncharacterized protein K02A2.6 [Trichonephila clavipes]
MVELVKVISKLPDRRLEADRPRHSIQFINDHHHRSQVLHQRHHDMGLRTVYQSRFPKINCHPLLEKLFGVPNIVVSDNIPFNSYIYKNFANDWDFDYAFISPHYSPRNGMVEKAVGISKSIMKKAREDRRDYLETPQYQVLTYLQLK